MSATAPERLYRWIWVRPDGGTAVTYTDVSPGPGYLLSARQRIFPGTKGETPTTSPSPELLPFPAPQPGAAPAPAPSPPPTPAPALPTPPTPSPAPAPAPLAGVVVPLPVVSAPSTIGGSAELAGGGLFAAGQAERIETFKVTTPAGTAQATPLETSLVFPPGEVLAVEIVIPTGHVGLTGLRLAQAHRPIIPRGAADFVIANGETIGWGLAGFVNSGNWQAFTYNTGVFPHSHYVRFLVREVRQPALARPALVAPLAL